MEKDPRERKSFLSIFEESFEKKNGHPYSGFENEFDDRELTDELDHEILMHRDAHFAGDFDVMLDYYKREGVGMHPDIEVDRIEDLMHYEQQTGQNLAALMLTGHEMEKVAKARFAYEKLKELYETEPSNKNFPRLLADLILSEDEDPQEEINAVVSQGAAIVPDLLRILKADDFYDILFPGYGYAPYFAIVCLGKIKDNSAIVPLFEIIGRDTAFDEEVIVSALLAIGKEAKNFLLKVLKGRPLTQDNLNAAYALTAFGEDSEVSHVAFDQLYREDIRKNVLLSTYLICCCLGLKNTPEQEKFIAMMEEPQLPKELKQEMQSIMRDWQN